ncbi:uncharacterized protein HMPREF1541_10710 [Cyphellophora europaea CBS 101466]|uniref:Uncharacterized protein n=1 Tax=Cyphellophora europaea (strain CBS 101466) TaxID=1220924 RepID=W2S6A8_CYPE1|nr:uncharacterized protein HMPREF1541_10710 [Cyphellophora europaea CBS 101466]ETN44160.1 hypothetical protein HMPREF1541_10710 [Cyphellophora europaea CBS 101466]
MHCSVGFASLPHPCVEASQGWNVCGYGTVRRLPGAGWASDVWILTDAAPNRPFLAGAAGGSVYLWCRPLCGALA